MRRISPNFTELRSCLRFPQPSPHPALFGAFLAHSPMRSQTPSTPASADSAPATGSQAVHGPEQLGPESREVSPPRLPHLPPPASTSRLLPASPPSVLTMPSLHASEFQPAWPNTVCRMREAPPPSGATFQLPRAPWQLAHSAPVQIHEPRPQPR